MKGCIEFFNGHGAKVGTTVAPKSPKGDLKYFLVANRYHDCIEVPFRGFRGKTDQDESQIFKKFLAS